MSQPSPKKAERKKVYLIIPVVLISLVILALALWLYSPHGPDLSYVWMKISSENSHPALLFGAFLVLPAIGFPISPFLILIGLRFGSVAGIILMFCAMAAHLTAAYWITRRFFQNRFETLARNKNIHIPELPEKRRLIFGFVFMAVPGLSYTLKNHLLPLSGISFFPYFLCGWLIQGAMGAPFIVLGHAATRWSVPLFAGLFALFLVTFIFRKWVRKKYNRFLNMIVKE